MHQFRSFDEVWGAVTTEADYPSKHQQEKQKEDRASLKLLRSKYAVHYAVCTLPHCRKPRVIYKASPLTAEQKESLCNALDNFMYTCGGPVTTATDPLNGRAIARASLRCSDPVEFAYYHKKMRFPLCCSTCGVRASTDVQLKSDPQKKALYQIVLPQCETCLSKCLHPPVRKNLYFKKRAQREADGAPAPAAAASMSRQVVRVEEGVDSSAEEEDRGESGGEDRRADAQSSDEDEHGRFSSSSEGEHAGEPPDEMSDDEYEIEAVLDMRRRPGKPMEWLVKWKGYEVDREAASSWLCRADFTTQSSHEDLLAFERKRKRNEKEGERGQSNPGRRVQHSSNEEGGGGGQPTRGRDGSSATSSSDLARPSQPESGGGNTSRMGSGDPCDSSEDDDYDLLYTSQAARRARGRGRGRGRPRASGRARGREQ